MQESHSPWLLLIRCGWGWPSISLDVSTTIDWTFVSECSHLSSSYERGLVKELLFHSRLSDLKQEGFLISKQRPESRQSGGRPPTGHRGFAEAFLKWVKSLSFLWVWFPLTFSFALRHLKSWSDLEAPSRDSIRSSRGNICRFSAPLQEESPNHYWLCNGRNSKHFRIGSVFPSSSVLVNT